MRLIRLNGDGVTVNGEDVGFITDSIYWPYKNVNVYNVEQFERPTTLQIIQHLCETLKAAYVNELGLVEFNYGEPVGFVVKVLDGYITPKGARDSLEHAAIFIDAETAHSFGGVVTPVDEAWKNLEHVFAGEICLTHEPIEGAYDELIRKVEKVVRECYTTPRRLLEVLAICTKAVASERFDLHQ